MLGWRGGSGRFVLALGGLAILHAGRSNLQRTMRGTIIGFGWREPRVRLRIVGVCSRRICLTLRSGPLCGLLLSIAS
jgi:hypothetical protein